MEEELRVSVRHGHETLEVQMPSSARVKDLMERLQALTNVLPRGQKLIFKGKVLTPDMDLKEAKIANGSKIMMMASEGTHQGVFCSCFCSYQLIELMFMQSGPQLVKKSIGRKPVAPSKQVSSGSLKSKAHEKGRTESWKSTGIVSLAETALVDVPKDVWALGASVRVLDLSSTMLKILPDDIKCLSNLKRLNLRANSLQDAVIPWHALCSLKHLLVLALDANCLTSLPAEIQELASLRQLTVSNNQLTTVPEEIGKLSLLEKLDISGNRLKQVPTSVSQCASLLEIDLSKNFLTSIPSSVGDLQKLKVLSLDNNALKDIPVQILKGCTDLISLSLHGNAVTIEALREVDGWKEFDARRKSKYDKQIDFQVMGSSDGFDEGADTERTRHW